MRFLCGTIKVVNKCHMCNIFLKNDKKQSSEIQDIYLLLGKNAELFFPKMY